MTSAGQRSSLDVPTAAAAARRRARATDRVPARRGSRPPVRSPSPAPRDTARRPCPAAYPRGLLEPMRARVPAMAGQIDAAAERELIVDDDDLLMVDAADGMAVVEAEPDASRHAPAEPPSRERIALERVERGVVPGQDVAAKARSPPRDVREQLDRAGSARPTPSAPGSDRRVAVMSQPRMNTVCARAEQAPAAPAGNSRRRPERSKAIRAIDAPAVPSGLDDRGRRRRMVSPACATRAVAISSAGLARRIARLISHAIVSGTAKNNAAPASEAGDGSCSAASAGNRIRPARRRTPPCRGRARR